MRCSFDVGRVEVSIEGRAAEASMQDRGPGFRLAPGNAMPRAETLDLLIERAAPETTSSQRIQVVAGDARRCRVSGVVDDSRRVVPGSLFVARAGVGGDGLDHVDRAAR